MSDTLIRHIFHVPDIHCAGCISRIETKLQDLDEVGFVRVNLTLKQVVIDTKDITALDKIKQAITQLGFTPSLLDPSQQPDDHHLNRLLRRVAVAGFGMMNVMLLSIAVWTGAEESTRQFLHLISALFAVPCLIYASHPFFISAFKALRARSLNMDVPIALAILLATLNSLYASLSGGEHAYFDAALALCFFLLVGRYLTQRLQIRAQSAAAQLAKLQMRQAVKITAHNKKEIEETIPATDLNQGDIVLIRAGDIIPIDGVVTTGTSETDRSLLTGESVPVAVHQGDAVFAGESNIAGVLRIKVTGQVQDSLLSAMIELAQKAEENRHHYTALADKVASYYAPLVHLAAFLTFIFWSAAGAGFHFSINTAIAVLIITCPCALGLAVPAVVTNLSGRFLRRGILLKSPTALERLAQIDEIVFDKTGTLTTGQFVAKLPSHMKQAERACLSALASLSHHPYAKAIAASLSEERRSQQPISLDRITEVTGKGIKAYWHDKPIYLGHPHWVCEKASSAYTRINQPYQQTSMISFWIEGHEPVFLPIEEEVRDGMAEMITKCKTQGYHVTLMTGDSQEAGEKLGQILGVDVTHCAMSPKDKAAYLEARQSQGAHVMMVGDGLNDTAAMSGASLSLAPSSALDATRAAADILVLDGSIDVVPDLLRLGRLAKRRMIENFMASGVYNLIFVPLAMSGIATPLWAAIAMSLSSVTVILNAYRLPSFAHIKQQTASKDDKRSSLRKAPLEVV